MQQINDLHHAILLPMQTDNLLAPLVQLRKALSARVVVPHRKSDELRRNPHQGINGPGLHKLDEASPEGMLHKTVRPWVVKGQSVDVLLFDDIGVYACVNYEDGEKQRALAFIASLGLPEVCYVEVPFNVLKRRKMGLPDFDG